MPHRPFMRLESHHSCRPEFQGNFVVEHGSMRVIELPPVHLDEAMPRRELPPAVGLLATLVIAASLLFIAHDGDVPPTDPALSVVPAATPQG